MKYRRFGRTGLQVSELVFGGGFVGGILLHQDDETKRTAIRRALDGGINWIDTAASYGNGKSEEALGWLLREIDETHDARGCSRRCREGRTPRRAAASGRGRPDRGRLRSAAGR